MAMSFIQLAEQTQRELDGEIARIKELEDRLNIRSSSVEAQSVANEKRTVELDAKAKELQAREEKVSQRELTVRRDSDAKADLDRATELARQAEEDRKKAQEYRDTANLTLEDLQKREVALSEREKTYKQDIELEVMRNFTFRK